MKEYNTRVVIKGLITYAHVFKPAPVMPTDKNYPDRWRYSTTVLIPKADSATIEKLNKAINEAKRQGQDEKWKGIIPSDLIFPIRDGDTVRPGDPIFKGMYFINAKSLIAPGIVDQHCVKILDDSQVYSGCTCNVSLSAFAYNTNGKRGVSLGLNNLQLVHQGEKLFGAPSPEMDFEEIQTDKPAWA